MDQNINILLMTFCCPNNSSSKKRVTVWVPGGSRAPMDGQKVGLVGSAFAYLLLNVLVNYCQIVPEV